MTEVHAGPNLIGRDAELAALRSFLGEAVVDGATLLLTGEPGVGKTALLVAAADMATTDGVRVIRGGGVEFETDVSYAGLHQLVDLLSDDLRRLPRSSRASIEAALGTGSGPPPDRLAVLTASLALFREVRTLYEARIERLPEATRRLLLLAVLDGSGGLGVPPPPISS